MHLLIADILLDVHVAHGTMEQLAGDYQLPDGADGTDGVDGGIQPDLRVDITQADIDAERDSIECSDGYLETLAVLRKIAEAAPSFDAFLMHGATIGYRGRAYAFLAHSGTGKSTHIQLWRDALGDQVEVINGDKPFVRRRGEEFIAYGTPYNGKECWGSNMSAPLAGLCLLERSEVDSLERLDVTADGKFVVEKLIQQVYVPRDPLRAAQLFGLLDQLVRTVPLWRLRCTPTPAAFRAAFPMVDTVGNERMLHGE